MLIAPEVLDTIMKLKREIMGNTKYKLVIEDALIAVSVSAATNPIAKKVLQNVTLLKGTQAHSTVMIPSVEEDTFRRLKISVTADAEFASKELFMQ